MSLTATPLGPGRPLSPGKPRGPCMREVEDIIELFPGDMWELKQQVIFFHVDAVRCSATHHGPRSTVFSWGTSLTLFKKTKKQIMFSSQFIHSFIQDGQVDKTIKMHLGSNSSSFSFRTIQTWITLERKNRAMVQLGHAKKRQTP